jgi:hypothetical protein
VCHHNVSSEGNGGISRREFIAFSAAAAAAGGFLLRPATPAEAAQGGGPEPQAEWPDIRVVYMRPKEKYWLGWPGTAWEVQYYDEFMRKTRSLIEQFAKDLKMRVRFEPEPLYSDAAAEAFVADVQASKPSGVVFIPLHLGMWGPARKVAQSGIPTVVYAMLGTGFTGHIREISRLPNVYLVSGADHELEGTRFGMKMIRTHHDIRRTRIAVLVGDETKDEVLEPFGLMLRRLPRQRFADALAKIGETPEVIATADEYQKAAQKIVEPSRTDIINASKNYYASLKIMEEENCQGITMDCLGAVFDRQIPCPPCMAWCKLLDAGIPAICEADINAVMSHTLCCKLLDRPGFQQDPVPETRHNTLIGAHCVCATRLNGYDRPREPFILRSHSESNVGVSLQVLWRPEQEVTLMQFVGAGKMILGKGKVLRNNDTPPAGGCRTSVELEIDAPPDTRDTKGFHQLFIYGDHVHQFEAYAHMYGIETEHV